MTRRTGSRRLTLEWRGVLTWLAALVFGGAAIAWLYPRVFPLGAEQWQIQRHEAITIVEERLRDLGEAPPNPYTTATLSSNPVLEMRLSRALRAGTDPQTIRRSTLEMRAHVWRVSVYAANGVAGDWAYLAEVSLDGEVLSLAQGVPPDFTSDENLEIADAISRSDRFLVQQGFDLEAYGEPQPRQVDLARYSFLILRYPAREKLLGDEVDYGVEVRFSADLLRGFVSWLDDPAAAAIGRQLRPSILVQTSHIFVIFLMLPFLGIYFVRRYHEGVVGVTRGAQIFAVVLTMSVIVLAMTVRSFVEGSEAGNITRQQMTWLGVAVMLVIYFPALSTLGLMGAALGESTVSGVWRTRLASFDALFRLRWNNTTVACAALRGVTAGLLTAAAVIAGAALLQRSGLAEAPSALLWGPWWENAAWPGVALLLVATSFTLATSSFGLLLLQPRWMDRFGPWLGGALVALVNGVLFSPLLNVVPVGAGLPLWIGAAAVWVFLFYRYDFVTALLGSITAQVALGALPLLHAADPALQLQGWIALLGAALPLLVSARYLGGEEHYRYIYNDVPPHVRRIAERERQRVELETARRIQSSILPELPEQLCGVELAHTYLPASEVGGDFYDVLALEDGRLAIAIGDVAGHGVSSGLIMSMTRSALAVQVTFRPEVEDVFRTLNRVVFQSARRRLLTTLCYAVLEPEERRLRFASAGHLYPYRISTDGHIQALESTAYPLGVREHLQIQVREHFLQPGDALFLSSDGLVEARRFGGDQLFGFERLEESLVRNAGRGARGLLEAVLEDVDHFVAAGSIIDPTTAHRDDDLTAMVLKLPG